MLFKYNSVYRFGALKNKWLF